MADSQGNANDVTMLTSTSSQSVLTGPVQPGVQPPSAPVVPPPVPALPATSNPPTRASPHPDITVQRAGPRLSAWWPELSAPRKNIFEEATVSSSGSYSPESQFIKIKVGPKPHPRTFIIPTRYLTKDAGDLILRSLSGYWLEGKDYLELPGFMPEIFQIFLVCLHTSQLPNFFGLTRYKNGDILFVKAWLLGDYLLADASVNDLTNYLIRSWTSEELYTMRIRAINMAFEMAPPTSPMRKLVAAHFVLMFRNCTNPRQRISSGQEAMSDETKDATLEGSKYWYAPAKDDQYICDRYHRHHGKDGSGRCTHYCIIPTISWALDKDGNRLRRPIRVELKFGDP